MLHRSSTINKIVINIMIIEVMYKAKLPHTFVDSRSRGVIARIRRMVGYTESVKHGGRPRGSMCDDYRSYGQIIVAPSLTSSAECLSLPEGGSKLVGSDQNQRGRLIDLFYVNWSV